MKCISTGKNYLQSIWWNTFSLFLISTSITSTVYFTNFSAVQHLRPKFQTSTNILNPVQKGKRVGTRPSNSRSTLQIVEGCAMWCLLHTQLVSTPATTVSLNIKVNFTTPKGVLMYRKTWTSRAHTFLRASSLVGWCWCWALIKNSCKVLAVSMKSRACLSTSTAA